MPGPVRRLCHRTAGAVAVGWVVLSAAVSFAQPIGPAGIAAAGAELPVGLEPFFVTGSLIKRTDYEGPSPIKTIPRSEIQRVAGTGLADVLGVLPEATNLAINENTANSDTRGATALDLRSLGPANTLVLVDGRRQAPNGIAADGVTFVDINRFPLAMIERVEVLKDGAAAIYGADATAGVVNIILRKDYTGTEISGRYGNYFRTDGGEKSWSLLTGARRGRFRGALGITHAARNAIAAKDLPFSADADQTDIWRAIDPVKYAAKLLPVANGRSFFDLRSGSGPYATVFVPAVAQLAHPSNGLTPAAILNPLTGITATFLPGTGGVPQGTLGRGNNRASVPRENNPGMPTAAQFVERAYPAGPLSNSYNFQEMVWSTSAMARLGLSANLECALAPSVDLKLGVSWTRQETDTRLAPPPIFTLADNAILVPANNYYNPFGILVGFGYRSLEVGPRIVTVASDSLGLNAVVKGTLQPRFEWELGWAFSANETADTQTNLRESKVRAALAKTTPDALNIFGGPAFRNNPATIESLKVNSTRAGDAQIGLADFRITTLDLFSWPMGKVGASAAVEHRLERFNVTNDELSSVSDDIIGVSPAAAATRSRRDVQSVSGELRFPLVREKGLAWLRAAELNTAARFERFSDGYDSGLKPYVGLRFQPAPGLLLRATYGKVFRAPSLPQLYGGTIDQFLSLLPDLRRPDALTGDSADAAGSPRLVRTGGNPRLRPEDGTTRQAGVVWDVPGRMLKGLTLEVTYGIIEQKGLIRGSLGSDFILRNELTSTGDLVLREPGTATFTNRTGGPIGVLAGADGTTRSIAPGESVSVPGRITSILDAALNLSDQIVRYYDYGMRHRWKSERWGRFTVSSDWTYYGYYAFRRRSTDQPLTSVGRSIPRYRGQSSLGWEREKWSANVGFHYTHRYRDLNADGWEVGRYYTFSAGLGYSFGKDFVLRGARLSIGVDNLLDREPPADRGGSGAGYDQGFVGRPAGRFGSLLLRQSF